MTISDESLIIDQTEHYVAVYKPMDMAVHPSDIHKGEHTLMHSIKHITGKYLYPVHRIDRAASGLVLFALNSETAAFLRKQFNEQTIQKQYLAVVRGHILKSYHVEHAVNSIHNSERKSAETLLEPLAISELPIASERYTTSRFSLISAYPKTGRWHQIRLHCSYIGYPIVGDVKHGDGATNRTVRESLSNKRLLLHSYKVTFQDQPNGVRKEIICLPDNSFRDFTQKAELEYGFDNT